MQGRGLKQKTDTNRPRSGVAPHAGAWIETSTLVMLPLRRAVAPHAGAWIETRSRPTKLQTASVAPHAGAWIETP